MSALGQKADIARSNRETASRRSLRNCSLYFRYAANAADFFFLRQPSKPNAPRPVAKSGRAAGSGMAETTGVKVRPARELEWTVLGSFSSPEALLPANSKSMEQQVTAGGVFNCPKS